MAGIRNSLRALRWSGSFARGDCDQTTSEHLSHSRHEIYCGCCLHVEGVIMKAFMRIYPDDDHRQTCEID